MYRMTGVQEGIEDVDSGIKFLLEFSDSKDTREGPQCTWIQVLRWLRIRVIVPLLKLWKRC